jgi:hypothetical protein
MLFATTAAAKSAVMNSLRQASKQMVRSENQSVRIAVQQLAVPVGPAAVTTTTRGMAMVDQMKSKVRTQYGSRTRPYVTMKIFYLPRNWIAAIAHTFKPRSRTL